MICEYVIHFVTIQTWVKMYYLVITVADPTIIDLNYIITTQYNIAIIPEGYAFLTWPWQLIEYMQYNISEVIKNNNNCKK